MDCFSQFQPRAQPSSSGIKAIAANSSGSSEYSSWPRLAVGGTLGFRPRSPRMKAARGGPKYVSGDHSANSGSSNSA